MDVCVDKPRQDQLAGMVIKRCAIRGSREHVLRLADLNNAPVLDSQRAIVDIGVCGRASVSRGVFERKQAPAHDTGHGKMSVRRSAAILSISAKACAFSDALSL